ncbi:NAD(P)-binding protein [Stipitochalara longipes BDJ]|nr:NAD(P)-binding protein [Stipitochalara longipes BDJ]
MGAFPSPVPTWHTSTYPALSPTLPSHSLAGKTVLLTGGSAGIGLSIAHSIAQASALNLIILGRREAVLASASQSITSQAGNKTKVFTVSADVSKKEGVDAAFTKIGELLPGVKLDILVLNAGYFTGLRPLGTETVQEWQSAFEVNILSPYLVTSAFLRTSAKDAKIINISTAIAHLPPFQDFSSYGVTKLGGAKLLDYFAAENPEIRIVNVHPGQVTETEMAGKAKGSSTMQVRGHIDDAQLAGDFVVWCLSDEAAFLKGKFVWVNWDVEELVGKKAEIEGSGLFTLGMEGFASFK